MTKTYKIKKIIFSILSFLSIFVPLLVFIIIGYAQGAVVSKVVLSITSVFAIVLALGSLLMKLHLRSPVFIVLIGLWSALNNLLPFIIVISITTILDELIFTPLKKKYKNLYTINKEIDKRG